MRLMLTSQHDTDTISPYLVRSSVLPVVRITWLGVLQSSAVLLPVIVMMAGLLKLTDAALTELAMRVRSYTVPHGELQKPSVIGDLLLTPCQKRAVQAFVGLDGSASGFGVEVIGTCQAGRE
jgi:hypothetical protein